jgi:hypothetical protein
MLRDNWLRDNTVTVALLVRCLMVEWLGKGKDLPVTDKAPSHKNKWAEGGNENLPPPILNLGSR